MKCASKKAVEKRQINPTLPQHRRKFIPILCIFLESPRLPHGNGIYMRHIQLLATKIYFGVI